MHSSTFHARHKTMRGPRLNYVYRLTAGDFILLFIGIMVILVTRFIEDNNYGVRIWVVNGIVGELSENKPVKMMASHHS